MKNLGNSIIWLASIITLIFFILSKESIAEVTAMPWISASQALSLIGTMLLSWSFILSSRAFFLEYLFGGLDKVLRVHHIVGGISFLMLINHPLFLAVDTLPNFNLASKYLWFSTSISYNLGVGALYAMIFGLLLTLVIKLPYDMWLKTHDFMGLVLLLGSLHIFMISSDVSRYLPLRIWMFVWLGMAIFSFVYKVFLYKGLGPKHKYRVDEVKRLGDVLEVYLEAIGEKLKHKVGQFAFIGFESSSLKESHPFTISSSPDSEYLRFSIKALGDGTLKLRQLKAGAIANVWGPYGKFYKGFDKQDDVVLIGGGIGITPMLSMLNWEANNPIKRNIHLFYGASNSEDAVYDGEITSLLEKIPHLNYYRYFGGNKPRISAEILKEHVGELHNKKFFICGPLPMMESLVKQLKNIGVKTHNIIFEDFSFKE